MKADCKRKVDRRLAKKRKPHDSCFAHKNLNNEELSWGKNTLPKRTGKSWSACWGGAPSGASPASLASARRPFPGTQAKRQEKRQIRRGSRAKKGRLARGKSEKRRKKNAVSHSLYSGKTGCLHWSPEQIAGRLRLEFPDAPKTHIAFKTNVSEHQATSAMQLAPRNAASMSRRTACFASFPPQPQRQGAEECGNSAGSGLHDQPPAQDVRLQDNCGKHVGRRGVLRVNARLTICP